MPDDNHPKLVKPPAYELACAVTTTTPSLAACPSGWTHQGTSCYSGIQTAVYQHPKIVVHVHTNLINFCSVELG